MTDPQWVAPGTGGPVDPQHTPPGEHPAYQGMPPQPMPTAQPMPTLQPASAPPGTHGQQPWGAHPAMEFRPGIIPLRPLALGDLYGAVIKTIRGNVGATMGLAFLTTLIFLVPTTGLGTWIASFETVDFGSDAVPVAGTIGQYLPVVGTYLSGILLTGFVAWVVGGAVQGRKTNASRTWEGTRGRVGQLVGATILVTVAMLVALAAVVALPILLVVTAVQDGAGAGDLVGAILLLVLAVFAGLLLMLWLSTRLAFLPAVIVLEQRGVMASLDRSWRLTSGRPFWRILGIRVLTGFIVGTVAQVITFPLAFLGIIAVLATSDPANLFTWQAVITGVTGLITGAVTTPFTAGVDALLYVDQRIRREGFDVQLITAAQADAAREAPGAPAAR